MGMHSSCGAVSAGVGRFCAALYCSVKMLVDEKENERGVDVAEQRAESAQCCLCNWDNTL